MNKNDFFLMMFLCVNIYSAEDKKDCVRLPVLRKKRLGLLEKEVEQKPKTIDPLDHMAVIAGLMKKASVCQNEQAKIKYQLYASLLASRLISEHDADKFFFSVRQQGSSLTRMLVRSQSIPKESHHFNKVLKKATDPYKIVEFRTSIPFRPDSEFHEVTVRSKLVFVDKTDDCKRFGGYEVVVPSNLSPGIDLSAASCGGAVCKYNITDETYHASKPLGRSWYPDHEIVVEVCHVTGHVSLYAIPHKTGYKDKDV